MRMSHTQPGGVTDPASSPVAEPEDGGSTPTFLLLDPRAQEIALHLFSDGNFGFQFLGASELLPTFIITPIRPLPCRPAGNGNRIVRRNEAFGGTAVERTNVDLS